MKDFIRTLYFWIVEETWMCTLRWFPLLLEINTIINPISLYLSVLIWLQIITYTYLSLIFELYFRDYQQILFKIELLEHNEEGRLHFMWICLCFPILFHALWKNLCFFPLYIVVCRIVETSVVSANSSTLRWNSDKHPQQKF